MKTLSDFLIIPVLICLLFAGLRLQQINRDIKVLQGSNGLLCEAVTAEKNYAEQNFRPINKTNFVTVTNSVVETNYQAEILMVITNYPQVIQGSTNVFNPYFGEISARQIGDARYMQIQTVSP